jgi:FMN-dependent NADH-azoreductase
MKHLLRIDSSSRTQGSYSCQLGDFFENLWVAHDGSFVTKRDLATHPVHHIHSITITGMFTPPDELSTEQQAALEESDTLIAQIKAADALLLTMPMYNFGVPSSLKAWIDHISRIGHTFAYDGQNFTGLLVGKKVYIVIAYGAGGYGPDGSFAAANFVEPYLKFLLGFLGITDIMVFNHEATNTDPNGIAAARDAIQQEMRIALSARAASSTAG